MRLQPMHGANGSSFRLSSRIHLGPTTSGCSTKITVCAGISRLATIYRPSSSERSITKGRQTGRCWRQSFFWCSILQYQAALHAVHLNGAGCWQTAHDASVDSGSAIMAAGADRLSSWIDRLLGVLLNHSLTRTRTNALWVCFAFRFVETDKAPFRWTAGRARDEWFGIWRALECIETHCDAALVQ